MSVNIAQDYPYLRQRLAEEELSRTHTRHDSAATIRANVGPLSLATKHLADLLNMSNQLQSDDIPTAKPSAAPLPVPTKENDWLGFCQSAIKLQNGDRKVNLPTAKAAQPLPGPY
jgi:hypothetical protein